VTDMLKKMTQKKLITYEKSKGFKLTGKWYTTTYTDDKITPSQNTRVKAFQAEEFKQDYITLKYDGQTYHPVKYIHAEYDLDKGYFKHFDGALHLYTPEEYFARRDQDFHYNLKNPIQIK